MLMRIPGMLPPDEVRRARGLLAAAQFVDGRGTASGAAAAAKKNLQLAPDHPARKELDQLVMAALGRSTSFQEAAFPKAVMPPTYNRYDVGMEYGFHVDAPLVFN